MKLGKNILNAALLTILSCVSLNLQASEAKLECGVYSAVFEDDFRLIQKIETSEQQTAGKSLGGQAGTLQFDGLLIVVASNSNQRTVNITVTDYMKSGLNASVTQTEQASMDYSNLSIDGSNRTVKCQLSK